MSEGKNISMKLLVDNKNGKVLFAEAGKECTDFLFYLLALPIGTVVRCLTKEAMVGSIGNLFNSLENLSADYLQANVSKDCLLNPAVAVSSPSQLPSLMINQAPYNSAGKTFYTCADFVDGDCSCCVSDYAGAICPDCKKPMTQTMPYVGAPPVKEAEAASEGGYVKGVVTYMIMDDLVVNPMSTISSITMLNKFNVKDVGCLEDRVVSVDAKQGLALLKASLMSKTVLSDVFLGKRGV